MEYVASAQIVGLHVVDPGEISQIRLALPAMIEVDEKRLPLIDTMRPGTAFLAKPWGMRTHKHRRRMYTRSNSSSDEPGILETFVNHTHRSNSDTSIWWQSDSVRHWYNTKRPIEIRVRVDETSGHASVFENTLMCKKANLRLEPEGEWEGRRFVCVAFGTGVTPFLSYLRYMVHHDWGRGNKKPSVSMTLIASVRHEGQLMLHENLTKIAREFSEYFRYVPVLTRSWPHDWPFLTGRIVRTHVLLSGDEQIDVTPFLEVVPDLAQSDLRVCGSSLACRQLLDGLHERNLSPLTIRTESW